MEKRPDTIHNKKISIAVLALDFMGAVSIGCMGRERRAQEDEQGGLLDLKELFRQSCHKLPPKTSHSPAESMWHYCHPPTSTFAERFLVCQDHLFQQKLPSYKFHDFLQPKITSKLLGRHSTQKGCILFQEEPGRLRPTHLQGQIEWPIPS